VLINITIIYMYLLTYISNTRVEIFVQLRRQAKLRRKLQHNISV